jgi:hypothetical protein
MNGWISYWERTREDETEQLIPCELEPEWWIQEALD